MSKKIKCPNCGEEIELSKSDYDAILSQVRDDAFTNEIQERTKLIEAAKEKELENLIIKEQASSNEKISGLDMKLKQVEKEKELLLSEKEKEILQLKEKYKEDLKNKEDEVAYYRDLKAKLSTKLVGETLEQHCQNKFNEIRTLAFPKAEFGKDNTVSKETSSKGDYIYREYTDDGAELISIMFEMKNETDTTTTKKKNEDFLKELDKDRNEKKCEYAVLVSMLEPDNDFYNAGIVDISYKYPKMFVVRPQCFITIISLLRNAAMNAVSFKNELMLRKAQSLDVEKFEEKLNTFKSDFAKKYGDAQKKFGEAITEIDKTIDHLMKVREALLKSEEHLGGADRKLGDLTIKKLTYGNKTMRELFENTDKTPENDPDDLGGLFDDSGEEDKGEE
ncbi:MAG: DUF2130 domain-containing protein [Clostridia bacterium]|nr:DUF2130 domain-containing protein [Clostridia bacterium]